MINKNTFLYVGRTSSFKHVMLNSRLYLSLMTSEETFSSFEGTGGIRGSRKTKEWSDAIIQKNTNIILNGWYDDIATEILQKCCRCNFNMRDGLLDRSVFRVGSVCMLKIILVGVGHSGFLFGEPYIWCFPGKNTIH